MKRFTCLALMIAPAFAGDLYQHIQLPMVDAYIDSSVNREPELPGFANPASHSISISVSTVDSQTSCFAVYLRVGLKDGTSHIVRTILNRDGVNPSVATFSLGDHKPMKIEEFYVVRMHAEPLDHLVARN